MISPGPIKGPGDMVQHKPKNMNRALGVYTYTV
jgi:hypothetical protein